MTEDEMIKTLAEPILKKLQEIEEQYGDRSMVEIPSVHFVRDQLAGPLEVNGIEITDELLDKLEEYIQDEIEMIHKPTVLH